MEHLKMQTADMADRNIEQIGALFPECLTERINSNGRVEQAIDFDKLRQLLAHDVVEGPEQRYQFTWPDKRAAIRLANTPTSKTLRPCRAESVDFDTTQNLYIEGDNLDVLKLLRENYLGKVKMIYIDPPYNTGNDFVYNDDFAQGKTEFEQRSGLFDAEGNQTIDPMQRNTEANGRFHTDWLNMIYPRLKVARDLLSDDGVIFISIDDNEVDNLKKICDEIFGAVNFITTFAIENNPKGRKNNAFVSKSYEYCMCYAKNTEYIYQQVAKRQEKKFFRGIEVEKDTRATLYDEYGAFKQSKRQVSGINKSNPLASESTISRRFTIYHLPAPEEKIALLDEYDAAKDEWIISPKGATLLQQGYIRYCSYNLNNRPTIPLYSKETILNLFNKHLLYFKEDNTIYEKDRDNTQQINSFIGNKKYGIDLMTESATSKMESLFGIKGIFSNSKSVDFIKMLVKLYNSEDFIICDFFSGSATTAHAVMQLNAEDGGNRKFIMVQLPEKTDPKSEAYKAGYPNICEIGKERIRRAGKKIKEENKDKEAIDRLDTGFRVLKLDSSNMADVYYTPAQTPIEQTLGFEAFEDNIKPDRTAEDLLFQVMPECNLPLSSRIEEREIHGKKVYAVDDNYLVACFDRDIDEQVITEIARMQPYYFVMRDASAATDNVLDNFDQIFNAYSKETIRRIL